MHITHARYFPKDVGAALIFCPYEKTVRRGRRIQYWVMLGVFFIPILPVARVYEWQCEICRQRVVPNIAGKHSKKGMLFNSVVALGGFAMFAIFLHGALTMGGKNSAFDPGSINAARGLVGFFSFLGFLIFAYAVYEARRVTIQFEKIVSLSPQQLIQIDTLVEPDDDVPAIATKLTAHGFTPPEIETYLQSWVKPEA
jgi:hypothetical protein